MLQAIYTMIATLMDQVDKKERIDKIQDLVYNDETLSRLDERIQTVLEEFAHDIDFYEPDPTLRLEDSSFYDDVRLKKEIETVLKNWMR